MSEWVEILAEASRLVKTGEPALLATLVGTQGPSYRPAGAMMVAGLGVPRVGGISGGCLEDYVIREGLRVTREGGGAAVMSFDTTHDPDDVRPVPGCGGKLHVLVERLSEEHVGLLAEIAHFRGEDVPVTLTTRVDGMHPGKTKVKRGVQMAGESGQTTQRLVGTEASPVWELEQYISPSIRLVLFGADDDARPVVRAAKLLGWHVSVLDRRARLATRERFAEADEVHGGPWERLIDGLAVGPRTAVVVMTHSVPDDAAILPWAARQHAGFVGLLGPTSRRDVVVREAEARGESIDAEGLGRVRSPVGLDLGEKSPGAIAVAIVGEVLAVMNARGGGAMSKAVSRLAE